MNPILVIHAVGNKEREENILKQFSSQIIFHPYQIFPATMMQTARYGISKSHKRCIAYAKEQNWPYAVVAEDDLNLLSPHSLRIFYSTIQLLPEDCDIFLGGIHSGEVTDPDNSVGYSGLVGKFSGLHLYWVPARFYDKFLEADEQYHLDFALGLLKPKVLVAYPILVGEISGPSYNSGQIEHYSKYLCQKYRCIK